MTHRYIKIGITVLVLGGAFGGMLWATLRDGTEFYTEVGEVLPHPQQWEGKRLQLHGYVVPGSILRSRNDSLEWRFQVQHNPIRSGESGGVIDASYTGIVPDTFKGEAEVLLKGELMPGGGFQVSPNGVIAKCPSKYEAQASAATY